MSPNRMPSPFPDNRARRPSPKSARLKPLPAPLSRATRRHTMATLRKDIAIAGNPIEVWQAVRDFGAVHSRVAPGFLTDLRMDKGDRVVTFFNGLVARERLVTVDDEACRLVYAIVDGRPEHYNASVEVLAEGEASRIVWTIDLLPDDLAPTIEAM